MPVVTTCDRCGKQLFARYGGSVTPYITLYGSDDTEQAFACDECSNIVNDMIKAVIRIWRKGGKAIKAC